jgi:RHH-type rel operon transcriptional repressor/antitoxin RelB
MTAQAFAETPCVEGLPLDPSIDMRLSQLSTNTGRTKVSHLQELLEEGLDDIEDARLGATAMELHRQSGEPSIPLDQVMRNLGLDV